MIINNWYNKYTFRFVLLCTTLLLIIFVAVCIAYTNLNIKPHMQTDINKIYSSSLIILTFILVCAAWSQLKSLEKISKSDFLLRIINHVNDESIIKAKRILHKFRIAAELNNGPFRENISNTVGHNIRLLRERLDATDVKDFIYVKNLLDYLEHVAYLCNKGDISAEDIKGCIAEPICTYYEFYEELINFYRTMNNDNSLYRDFENLKNKIRPK